MGLVLIEHPLKKSLKTIYVGGGTPTSLDVEQLERLLEVIKTRLPLEENGEFTFEANPEDLTFRKLSILKNAGVNRLSIGIQTFDDQVLQAIGRTHRKEEVLKGMEMVKEMGFANTSIDLMYGLPEQTIKSVSESVDIALQLQIPHLSLYSLIIEPKTVFYNLMKKGKLQVPTQDTEADMYDYIIGALEKNGYYQYEISNFAFQGFESKHNLVYWDNEEYYGFGAGAHSYLGKTRKGNIKPLQHYMKAIEKGKVPVFETTHLTEKQRIEEELFLGLRKTEGVNASCFQQKFGVSIESVYEKELVSLMEKELIDWDRKRVKLTKKGLFLGNDVFQRFLKD